MKILSEFRFRYIYTHLKYVLVCIKILMWGVVECDVCGKQQFIVSGFSLEFCVEIEEVKAETSWHTRCVWIHVRIHIYAWEKFRSQVRRL